MIQSAGCADPPATSPAASKVLPPPARVAMVRELSAGMAESYAAGDLVAARVAFDAIGPLLGGE